MSSDYSPSEFRLLDFLKSQELSLSHQVDHAEKVAGYAKDLARLYEGDEEVVVAAALLHDIGRADLKLRHRAAATKAAEWAAKPLQEAGYTAEQIEKIQACIAEHDDPGNSPSSKEALILKEADFLAGFGAEGVLRSIQYTTELKAGREEMLERIVIKARKRLESLTLPAARRMGWKLYRFMEVFVAELKRVASINDYGYSGKLLVLEGISGCGKDTQAEMLEQTAQEKGLSVEVVHHPTAFMKEKIWRVWRTEVNDRESELYMIMADRVRVVKEQIWPALKAGKLVISTRSVMSAMVYQAETGLDQALYPYLFLFEPVVDLLVYLQVSPETAWMRSQKRTQEDAKEQNFFNQKQSEQLARYEQAMKYFPNVERVDAEGSIETVAGKVNEVVEKAWGREWL